jgi:hypothetical protein
MVVMAKIQLYFAVAAGAMAKRGRAVLTTQQGKWEGRERKEWIVVSQAMQILGYPYTNCKLASTLAKCGL